MNDQRRQKETPGWQLHQFCDVTDGCAKDNSPRRAPTRPRQSTSQGIFVDHQSVTFAVWLGLPVLALIVAYITLWHTRRQLRNLQQSHCPTQLRLATAPDVRQRNPAIAS